MEYHMTRPREAVAQRLRLPVAYLGLGILEWHGFHNPLGLDGIKAHLVLEYLSNKVGGLTMPPLFWGDHRGDICELVFDPKVSNWLPPGTHDHATQIADAMHLSRARLEEEGRRSDANGGWRLYVELLVHTFFQIESLGFKMIVPFPGHYPLITPVRQAAAAYKDKGGTCTIFILMDQLAHEGDHAAKLETSLLLALKPELVDLGQLEKGASWHLGVLGEDPLQHASPEFGRAILDKLEAALREQVKALR